MWPVDTLSYLYKFSLVTKIESYLLVVWIGRFQMTFENTKYFTCGIKILVVASNFAYVLFLT